VTTAVVSQYATELVGWLVRV